MSELFAPAPSNNTDPITNLPIGFLTDINERIESYYKCKEIAPSWQKIVSSNRINEINEFFNKHESSLLCSGSWYLYELIKYNNIDSLNYVLTKTKSFHINNPFTYCITNKYRNFTPIQFACSYCNFDTIKLLLNKGSDIGSVSNHRIINLLFQHNKCIDPLNITPCIHHLVSCGSKVPRDSIYYLTRYYNGNNNKSSDTLQSELAESYFDIVSLAQYLATKGADINYIATALERGHFDLAQFMIDNGAHLDDNILRYIINKQSFIWLFSNNYIKNIDFKNKYKGTALFYHTENNHYDAVQVLLSYGADVNIRCKYSNLTAIEVAMFSNFENIVKLLHNPSSYNRTPALLQQIESNNFEALPTNPEELKKILIDYHNNQEPQHNETKSEMLDMNDSSEIETEHNLIEQNVKDLLNKLKIEYDKLIQLQSVRNKQKQTIRYNRNKLNVWDNFESLWIHWNIKSFIEWLKRIKYEYVKSFYGYWQSDKHCIHKIENYIKSNPHRFGINNENENENENGNIPLFRCNDMNKPLIISPSIKSKNKTDGRLIANQRRAFLDGLKLGSSRSYPLKNQNDENDETEEKEEKQVENGGNNISIFRGEYLEYFDRYILDKIGIRHELDCDIVCNEIARLKRKYPNINKQQIENDDNIKERRQCNVCCQRDTSHILQCGHPFCEFCIDEFQKTTNRCAICKTKIDLIIKMY